MEAYWNEYFNIVIKNDDGSETETSVCVVPWLHAMFSENKGDAATQASILMKCLHPVHQIVVSQMMLTTFAKFDKIKDRFSIDTDMLWYHGDVVRGFLLDKPTANEAVMQALRKWSCTYIEIIYINYIVLQHYKNNKVSTQLKI